MRTRKSGSCYRRFAYGRLEIAKSTTSPLVPPSIADAMCLPTASLAAFTGSSARWAYRAVVAG